MSASSRSSSRPVRWTPVVHDNPFLRPVVIETDLMLPEDERVMQGSNPVAMLGMVLFLVVLSAIGIGVGALIAVLS